MGTATDRARASVREAHRERVGNPRAAVLIHENTRDPFCDVKDLVTTGYASGHRFLVAPPLTRPAPWPVRNRCGRCWTIGRVSGAKGPSWPTKTQHSGTPAALLITCSQA